MDPMVFNVVCVPLLGVDHTALLAISTPDDECNKSPKHENDTTFNLFLCFCMLVNFYSELFELTNEEGGSLFAKISIGLACPECLENGLACTHRNDKLPHWRPLERQALIQAILSNNTDLANRESRGVVQSSSRNLYDRPWIKRLLADNAFDYTYKPDVIFLAVDPAGKTHAYTYNILT